MAFLKRASEQLPEITDVCAALEPEWRVPSCRLWWAAKETYEGEGLLQPFLPPRGFIRPSLSFVSSLGFFFFWFGSFLALSSGCFFW